MTPGPPTDGHHRPPRVGSRGPCRRTAPRRNRCDGTGFAGCWRSGHPSDDAAERTPGPTATAATRPSPHPEGLVDVDRELARLGIDVDPSRPEGHPALRGAPPVSPAVTRQALTLVSEPPVQLDDDGPVLELGVAAQPAARPDGRSLETRLGQPVRPHDVPDEADLEQTLRSDGHHPPGRAPGAVGAGDVVLRPVQRRAPPRSPDGTGPSALRLPRRLASPFRAPRRGRAPYGRASSRRARDVSPGGSRFGPGRGYPAAAGRRVRPGPRASPRGEGCGTPRARTRPTSGPGRLPPRRAAGRRAPGRTSPARRSARGRRRGPGAATARTRRATGRRPP